MPRHSGNHGLLVCTYAIFIANCAYVICKPRSTDCCIRFPPHADFSAWWRQCMLRVKKWRVGRRNFTRSLSQNGAGISQFTPLPSSKRAHHSSSPVHEELRTILDDSLKEKYRPCLPSSQPLKLSHSPPHQHLIDASEHRVQSCRLEFPVILNPSLKDRVETPGDVLQRKLRPSVKAQATQSLPHRHESR
jgi:hypothetical protein